MNAPLRVLGDRVLVKPDVNRNAPEQLESGVFLAKSLAAAVIGEDATTSVHRGTVVGVGRPKHPLHHEAETLADKVEKFARFGETPGRHHVFHEAADMLRDLVRRHPCVSVDDDVLFSNAAGQDTVIDGETYVILHEAEILAVVIPEPVGVL